MMDKIRDNDMLTVKISGRLDSITAPQIEGDLKPDLVDIKRLELDIAGVDYVSSAGLRVLLIFQKQMNKSGAMVVRNVAPSVMELFDMTGFNDILTIE